MESLMHWLIIHFISPLMLPLFMVATLCLIAGVKPEPIVQAVLSLLTALLLAPFRILELLLRAFFGLGRGTSHPYPPKPYPPKPHPSGFAGWFVERVFSKERCSCEHQHSFEDRQIVDIDLPRRPRQKRVSELKDKRQRQNPGIRLVTDDDRLN